MPLTSTRLATLGSAVTGVLFTTLAVCAWGFWSIVKNTELSADWEERQLVAERKVELASDMYRTMGYVGFIHHFKNLVLRQDLKYFGWAQASAQASKHAIDAYEKFASEDEKTHLATIRVTLETYTSKMLQIPELINSGVSIASLDHLVKVDDAPALSAIGALIESGRVDREKAAQGIAASFQNTAGVIRRMVTLMSLMIGLSILLSLYGIRQAVGGMGAIAGVFRRISAGEQVDSIPGRGKPNELGDLADAADAFREALRESRANEAYLEAIQEATVDGLIVIDTFGRVRYFNEAAEAIFGYRRNTVIGQNVSMLMPEAIANRHDAYLQTYLETGEKKVIGISRQVEAKRKNADPFPLELSVAEAKTDSIHVFVGLVRDITERVEMRRQLELRNEELSSLNVELKSNMVALAKAQEQIVQAEKMASLGRVVGGTAHAMNTPLGVAITSSSIVRSELLQMRKNIKNAPLEKNELIARLSRCDEAIGLVGKCLDRASELVKTLKALSLHERQDPMQALVFPDCMQDIMSSLGPVLDDAGIGLNIQSEGRTTISSYLITLADVMHALTSNTICHAFDDQEHKRLSIRIAHKPSGHIEIVVEDNGIGIPENMLPSIFEPFTSLKKAQGHHGLGLYAVHNLVTGRLKGTIHVTSKHPGGGTRFTISLPDLKADRPG